MARWPQNLSREPSRSLIRDVRRHDRSGRDQDRANDHSSALTSEADRQGSRPAARGTLVKRVVVLTRRSSVSKTRDIDVAKDRLVDSLSVARDATKTAVRDEIAPAVVAAVGAAREASGPMYAEAASRASDAVTALRGSDAAARASDAAKTILTSDAASRAKDTAKALSTSGTAKSLRKQRKNAATAIKNSDTVNKALRRDASTGRKRWKVVAVAAAAGVAVAALARGKSRANTASSDTYPAPVSTPPPAPSEAPIQAASVDLPVDEPTLDAPPKKK
jgi:hypothetical protein